MREVMVRAWEIAKEAVAKFGGKAVEYIAQALKMAWNEVKKGASVMSEIAGIKERVFKKWKEVANNCGNKEYHSEAGRGDYAYKLAQTRYNELVQKLSGNDSDVWNDENKVLALGINYIATNIVK